MSEATEQARCAICGEPMPPGEEMFKYHGYSGLCPKPPLPNPAPTRELTSHQVNGCNSEIRIEVMDGPGPGGACHLYHITGFNSGTNASDPWTKRHGAPATHSTVLFQNGPIKEKGTNGLTHEVLLAILEDRLASFQRGPYACEENAIALNHVREAQRILKHRTEKRVSRGVEGTMTV